MLLSFNDLGKKPACPPMINVCKICGKEFTERGLHGHIIKTHERVVSTYYEEFFPRTDKLTGEKIPYEDYHTYFDTDFVSKANMISWLKSASADDAKEFLLKKLKHRIAEKQLKYAPSFIELETLQDMPPYRAYVYFFGTYAAACKELGLEPLLLDVKEVEPLKPAKPTILIDTREQLPLEFPKSKSFKLAVGDYTLDGEFYNYTFVDRKAEGDFKSTVTMNQERFVREVQKAADLDSYLYVVVESSTTLIEQNNEVGAHRANMKYVWASMRRIQHMFPRRIQFVFSGSRENSQKIIPYLLRYGNKLWGKDVQYLLNIKGIV